MPCYYSIDDYYGNVVTNSAVDTLCKNIETEMNSDEYYKCKNAREELLNETKEVIAFRIAKKYFLKLDEFLKYVYDVEFDYKWYCEHYKLFSSPTQKLMEKEFNILKEACKRK